MPVIDGQVLNKFAWPSSTLTQQSPGDGDSLSRHSQRSLTLRFFEEANFELVSTETENNFKQERQNLLTTLA
jgi:hypothetical protein